MTKIKHYKVIEASSANELQQAINNHIIAGFDPVGGVSVCVIHTSSEYEESKPTYTYSQAVTDYHDA
jgi:hypothetical protein